MALDQLFPPLGLTLTLGSLSLRLLRDADLDAYVELKMQDVNRMRMTTHPAEFDMYYSL